MADAPDQTQIDAFVKAAHNGDIPALTAWLDRFGTKYIDALDSDGTPALSEASYYKQAEAALMLIDRGADVAWLGNGRGTYSPLICAASNGVSSVVRALIELGADVNEALPGGYTPLHYAVMNGYPDVALMLLAYGANIHAKTSDGWNVLMPLHEFYAERGEESSAAVRAWKESDAEAWHRAQGPYDPGKWDGIRQARAERGFAREVRQLTQSLTDGLDAGIKVGKALTLKMPAPGNSGRRSNQCP